VETTSRPHDIRLGEDLSNHERTRWRGHGGTCTDAMMTSKEPRWLTILQILALLSFCVFLWWLAAWLGLDINRYM
jgi:hypothetical protein